MCHKSFPSEAEIQLHLRTCVDSRWELRVQIKRLSEEQVLASAQGSSQVGNTEQFVPQSVSPLPDIDLETQESFLCSQRGCQFIFPTAIQLEFHMQVHKEKKAFLCGNCGKCCSSRDELAEHVKSHLPTKRLAPSAIKCTILGCGRRFFSLTDLKEQHILQHTRDDSQLHECQHCGKQLANLSLFNDHVKLHLKKPGILNCIHSGCKEAFKSSAKLRKHVASHTKFICFKCGMCCPSALLLKHHMKAIHLQATTKTAKPVATKAAEVLTCDICGTFFNSIYMLNHHKKLHLAERPYNCNVPGCSFSGQFPSDVINHKRCLHSKGFECHLCGYFVKHSRQYLQVHLQKHMTGTEGLLKCIARRGCKLTFTSSSDLKRHFLLAHKKVVYCDAPACDKEFVSRKSLDLHKDDMHGCGSWTCQLCGLQLNSKIQLRLHTDEHLKNATSSRLVSMPDSALEENSNQMMKFEIEEVILD